jgi:hypothetical protein
LHGRGRDALRAKGAPVDSGAGTGAAVRGGSLRAEHDAAGEHRGLAAVVRGDLLLGGVDVDALLARALAAALLRAGGRGRGRGGDGRVRVVRVDGREREAGARHGRARARARVRRYRGRHGAAPRRHVHVHREVVREAVRGGRLERRRAHLLRDAREERVLLVLVVLEQLLRERLGAQRGLGLEMCAEAGLRGRLLRLELGLRGELLGPDGEELAGGALRVREAERDTARVDEEVEFDPAERVDPLGPLDVSGRAGVVDRPRGQCVRREGEAAPARAPKRLGGNPRGSVMGHEVGFQNELETGDGSLGADGAEAPGEVGDGVRDGDREGSGRGHCDDQK